MSLPGIAAGVTSQGQLVPDNLIAGEFPRVTRLVTVTGNAPLTKGSVLGKISDDVRYQLSDASLTDGAEVPDVILVEDIDPSMGDVQAHVYLSGEFNASLLIFGEGHTLSSVMNAFRQRSLFLRTNQA